MHYSLLPSGSNQQLADLLQRGYAHLRLRELKRALNNAQIAFDFASRSGGESTDTAAAAQLLMAEAFLLNAAYTADESLRAKGWRTLEQLESTQQHARFASGLPIALVKLVRARSYRRLGEGPQAVDLLRSLVATPLPDRLPFVQTALSVEFARCLGEDPTSDAAELQAALQSAQQQLRQIGLQPSDPLGLALNAELHLAATAPKAGSITDRLQAAHLCLQLARQADLPSVEAQGRLVLGRLSLERGNFAIALRVLFEALDIAERLNAGPLLIEAHLALGEAYERIGNPREASTYLSYVAQQSERFERPRCLLSASYSLGRVALLHSQHEEAGRALAAALRSAQQLEDHRAQVMVLGELAELKFDEQQPELARHYVEAAQRMASDRLSPDLQLGALAPAHLAKAALLLDERHTQEALPLAEDAVEGFRNGEQASDLLHALQLLARIAHDGGHSALAAATERERANLATEILERHQEHLLPDLDLRAALRKRDREIQRLTQENALKSQLIEQSELIERANRDLVQANDELRQLAYVTSHDLKEPIRQLGSYASLLRRGYASQLDERGTELMSFITEGAQRVNRLLDSLMHYTSIARLDAAVETVDMQRLIGGVRSDLQTRLNDAGAVLEADCPDSVRTSGALLRHVLTALVDNAARFGREGTPPRIEVSVSSMESEYVCSVKDNGRGIEQIYHDKVFGLFQMLQAKAGFDGTGVGLAIAQKSVQRLGGRIWFEDNADASPGVTFHFTLARPAEESDVAAAA